MRKFSSKSLWLGLVGLAACLGVGYGLSLSAMATDIDPSAWRAAPAAEEETEETSDTGIAPTFASEVDEDDGWVRLRMGSNLLLAGNQLSGKLNTNGLLFVAGNSLNLTTQAEYGFLAGNLVQVTGTTRKDLFVAGNLVQITKDARIGRDVYVAASEVVVEADLYGDLSITAGKVTLKDVQILGNVNLAVEQLAIEGSVEIAGSLSYADDTTVSGLEHAIYDKLDVYAVQHVDESAVLMATWYAKIMSIAGLFVVMVVVIALCPKFHQRIEEHANTNQIGINLAVGLGVLLLMPLVALVALMTVVAAPLAVIVLVVWLIMIYLAQGVAGAWVGHLIIEKLFKSKANVFIEALLGIVVLGLLSMVPMLGVLTGLLGLLFGLGWMTLNILPKKQPKETPTYFKAEARIIAEQNKAAAEKSATEPKVAQTDKKSTSPKATKTKAAKGKKPTKKA